MVGTLLNFNGYKEGDADIYDADAGDNDDDDGDDDANHAYFDVSSRRRHTLHSIT